jgi:hypothetical protein
VCAQGDDGIFPLAEVARLVGGKRQELPPGLGTRREVLAQYRRTIRGEAFCWHLRTAVYPMIDLTGLLHLVTVMDTFRPQALSEQGSLCRPTSSPRP